MIKTRSGKIAVTGASGFVGHVLCRSLLNKGMEVVATGRQLPAAPLFSDPLFKQFSVGDTASFTEWTAALNGVEVVIHLAARVHVMADTSTDPLTEFRRINSVGTEHLARSAASCGVRRLVYVSSIKVNGESTRGRQKYTDQDLPAPQDPYGISKWEAEQALYRVADENGLEIVIVRPPLVYGAGVKGNFAQMLNVVTNGIPLPFASVHNQRSLIYVENLVDALIACATHPAAADQTYLVSDGDDISTPELLRQLAIGMGVPARLFPCPSALLRFAAKLVGKKQQLERLLGSLRVDGDKIRAELNWIPPYTLHQGLQATAEKYRTK